MIRGYLSELLRIAPFSVDTVSGGRPKLFHPATVASSVSTVRGFGEGLIGILLALKNGRKFWIMILSLKVLLKGPTYDTKAEESKTSPIMTSR